MVDVVIGHALHKAMIALWMTAHDWRCSLVFQRGGGTLARSWQRRQARYAPGYVKFLIDLVEIFISLAKNGGAGACWHWVEFLEHFFLQN